MNGRSDRRAHVPRCDDAARRMRHRIDVDDGIGKITQMSFHYRLITSLAQLPGYFRAAYLIEIIGPKPVLVMEIERI